MNSAPAPAPELEFVRCASRDPGDPHLLSRLQTLSAQTLPWKKLEATARKHGLCGLWATWLETKACEAWPLEFKNALQTEVSKTLHHNLQLLVLLKTIETDFKKLALEFRVLKGPVFTARAYGQLTRRASHDLDLLVKPAAASTAVAWLVEHGFRPQWELTPAQTRRLEQQSYAQGFLREADGLVIDLHTHLIRPGYSFRTPIDGLFEHTTVREVSGIAVPVLDAEYEVNLLAWHGAKHNWERLIWVRDLDAAIRAAPGLDWERVERQAAAWGGRKLLLSSLNIARAWFETPQPTTLEKEVQTLNVRGVIENLELLEESKTYRLDGPLRAALEQGSDRWRHLGRIFFEPGPSDWAWLKLPQALYSLYYPLRPVRLLCKRLF